MNRLIFMSVLALVGCTGLRGPTAEAMMGSDPTMTCFRRMNADPEARRVLHDKVGVGIDGPPTIQMLADKTTPTEEERQALVSFTSVRQSCIAEGTSYRRANMPPEVWMQIEGLGEQTTLLFARLYASDITYGDYNRIHMEQTRNAMIRLANSDRQRAQAQASDDERRGQAFLQGLQAAQQQQYQQQMLRQQQIQMNRPVTTDCSRFGNSVTCTSR